MVLIQAARGKHSFSTRARPRDFFLRLKKPARAIRRLFPSLSSNKKFLFSLFEKKIPPVNKVPELQTSYILFIAFDFASFCTLNFYFLYRKFLFNFK